ncbi:MAG: hypothetical protein ABI949_07420 [Ilumatobacteraceae bacterium]
MTTDSNRNEFEIDDKARDAASRAKQDVEGAGRTAADKAEGMGKRISDAVEDMIPGDSDHDGH